MGGSDGSGNLHEGISSDFTGIEVFGTSVIGLSFLEVSLDLGVVEEEVLCDLLLGDALGPGNDSRKIGGNRFAGSKLSGEGLSDSHKLGDSVRPVLGLDISEGSGESSLDGITSVVAGFNFLEVVLFNKAIKHSSNDSSDTLGSDGRKGNGSLGLLLVKINSHLDAAESMSLSFTVVRETERAARIDATGLL